MKIVFEDTAEVSLNGIVDGVNVIAGAAGIGMIADGIADVFTGEVLSGLGRALTGASIAGVATITLENSGGFDRIGDSIEKLRTRLTKKPKEETAES